MLGVTIKSKEPASAAKCAGSNEIVEPQELPSKVIWSVAAGLILGVPVTPGWRRWSFPHVQRFASVQRQPVDRPVGQDGVMRSG